MPISGLTDDHADGPGDRFPAVLLLGPTGSGKTPLGEMIEARGLAGRRCCHFDFGAELRRLAKPGAGRQILASGEVDFIRRVLETGVLLEDDRLPLAVRILDDFLERRRACADDWVVLNGLPRHPGQARGIRDLVAVRHVVELVCDAETVLERIRRDAGGDRAGRADDDAEAIRARLRTYELRTRSLADHYAECGACVHRVRVGIASTTATMYDDLWRLSYWGDSSDSSFGTDSTM